MPSARVYSRVCFVTCYPEPLSGSHIVHGDHYLRPELINAFFPERFLFVSAGPPDGALTSSIYISF